MPTSERDLISIDLTASNVRAKNGAPSGEPEVWDERIEEFNPRFGHAPEGEPVAVSPTFDVTEYLAEERTKDLLARQAAAGSGSAERIGAIFVDLDGFTAINDSVGHGAGDLVLAQAGRRLRESPSTGQKLA